MPKNNKPNHSALKEWLSSCPAYAGDEIDELTWLDDDLESRKKAIESICREARIEGYIALDNLNYVLADGDGYIKRLFQIWSDYQIDIRNKKAPKLDSFKDRAIAWSKVLTRFTLGVVEGIEVEQQIKLLKFYKYDGAVGDFKPSTPFECRNLSGHGPIYVSLKETESYFKKRLIQIPERLFGPGPWSDKNPNHVSSRHQQAKKDCREVARRLLEEKPNITISEAIDHQEMIGASERENGNCYLEKTVRNWINDLWPDEARRPGRPRK